MELTTRAAAELILFSPEAVRESFGGYIHNLSSSATMALAAFLILLGVSAFFSFARQLFH